MKPILFTFAFAATLAAQNFIQMSDPQFGMFTKDASFEHETVNFEFAIATANRLKPARRHTLLRLRPGRFSRTAGCRTYVIVECVRQTLEADRAWKREWRKVVGGR